MHPSPQLQANAAQVLTRSFSRYRNIKLSKISHRGVQPHKCAHTLKSHQSKVSIPTKSSDLFCALGKREMAAWGSFNAVRDGCTMSSMSGGGNTTVCEPLLWPELIAHHLVCSLVMARGGATNQETTCLSSKSRLHWVTMRSYALFILFHLIY